MGVLSEGGIDIRMPETPANEVHAHRFTSEPEMTGTQPCGPSITFLMAAERMKSSRHT